CPTFTTGWHTGTWHRKSQTFKFEHVRARTTAPIEDFLKMSTQTPGSFEWTELDRRAVDTARLLAADAVQKVGNGHPGTAMSLAPLAYLLYQRVLRHDPTDPTWIGRDRFILSNGHSSLTQYCQLFLSGYGLELADIESLRTW